MNSKNKKDVLPTPKSSNPKKQGKNPKEFVPSSKNAVREMNYFNPPIEINRNFKNEFEPIDLFPEWPGDEEAKNFDFGVIENSGENSYLMTVDNIFYDSKNDEINLPISILYYCQNEFKWLRPEQYVREYIVDKEIRNRFPNKNNLKLRKRIKETFIEMNQDKLNTHGSSGDMEDNQTQNSSNNKKNKGPVAELSVEEKRFRAVNKEIFKYYDMPLDIKIVNIGESDSDLRTTKSVNLNLNAKNNYGNELNLNLNSNNNNKDSKNNKNLTIATAVDKTKKSAEEKIGNNNNNNLLNLPNQNSVSNNKTQTPSDLSLEDRMPNFSKWMSSLMQIIKDLEMSQITSLIYPQKDGIPVYNPIGRYWVKLFHMGKFRKIEIDDRMPCSKFDEFLLPRCENLEELWPAILTKAIIKLFSYKTNKMRYAKEKFFNEVGDISILYSLTGFVPEHLNLNFINEEKFDIIENLLNDTRFLNNQKYFICYNNYALESTTKNLNYKNKKISDEINQFNLNSPSNRALIDLPYQGINIFKNYLKKINSKNKNFMFSEINLDANINFNTNETLQTEGNENYNNILTDSNNKIDKVNLKRPIIRNSESKNKLKSKSKTKQSNKLLPVKEINSPINTVSTPSTKKNYNIYNNKPINLLQLNIQDEQTLNKIYPINFKDSIINIQNEKEKKEHEIRISLLGKEKMTKLSPSTLGNFSAIESLQISKRDKTIVTQISKINNLFNKKEKMYQESSDLLIEQKLKNILSDTVYSIIDIFFSGEDFNMKRLQPVDFTDLKKKILAAQTNFKLLTAQEKKNYITNLKDLKLKQKEEKKQRLQELNEPGEKYFMIKIKNNIKNALNSFIPDFSEEEISITKKCLLNNWRFPPSSYFEKTFSKVETPTGNIKKIDGDASGDDLKFPNSIKLMNTSWTKNFYVNMIKNINEEPNNLNISHMNNKISHEEPEIYKNPKEVIERQKGGVWIPWKQFLDLFKGFVIIHNPKNYKSIVNIDSNWYNYKSDIYNNEKLAFFLTSNSANIYQNQTHKEAVEDKTVLNPPPANIKNPKDIAKEKETKNAKDINKDKDKDSSQLNSQILNNNSGNNHSNINPISVKYNTDINFSRNLYPNTKFYNNLTNSCLLIIFEPNTTHNYLFSDIKYYLIFDLIATNGKKIFSNIRLNGFFATYQFDEISFDQEYYLIITGGIHPFGYNLRILSDHYVETLTHFNYVKKFYGLNQHTLNVNYPAIEKNKIYIIARIKIFTQEKCNIFINIKQNEGSVDNYLKQFYEVFMVNKLEEKKIFLDKLQDLEASEDPFNVYQFNKVFSL